MPTVLSAKWSRVPTAIMLRRKPRTDRRAALLLWLTTFSMLRLMPASKLMKASVRGAM